MDITKEWILKNGFVYDDVFGYIGTYDKKYDDCALEFRCCSNMKGRDWSIHVDNSDCDSIGNCCVQTIEQVRAFLALLDIDFDKVLSQK